MAKKLGFTTSVFEGYRAILQSDQVGMDLLMCILGDKIADGHYRAVHQHAFDSDKVIKIEFGWQERDVHDCGDQNSFCNVQEFLLWREIEGLKGKLAWVKDWFAPVEWISPSGHVLCMKKTAQMPDIKRPHKIPDFLWDVKQENFGWIGDRFVCHDYANVSSLISYEKKMKNVKEAWN